MAEASGFRWTTLSVATLYPFGLPLIFVYALLGDALVLTGTIRDFPRVSMLVGYVGAGATALALTRSVSLDLSAWAVALAAYIAGGCIAAVCFQITRATN